MTEGVNDGRVHNAMCDTLPDADLRADARDILAVAIVDGRLDDVLGKLGGALSVVVGIVYRS